MITGTFIDEISHDIPSSNWGREEWDRDFQAMKSIGIDTVILIRAGYKDRATCESKVLRQMHPHLIVYDDLVELYLSLAAKYEMKFFFGTYDSGNFWHSGQHQKEIDINRAFTEEVWERYGHMPAFSGWYISHEINAHDEGVMRVYEEMADHLADLKDLPIMISPYIRGIKQFDNPITLEEHAREWEEVFSRISDKVDIVAFQDGNVEYSRLKDFLTVNCELARRYGLDTWSNVESFDRDMPIKFPPIDWRKLQFKIDAAAEAGVDKLITFEFSHFMSPNSIYPAAHGLYRRYIENYLSSTASSKVV